MPLKAEGEFALVTERMLTAFERAGQPVKRGTMAHIHELYMMLADSAAQVRDRAALEEYAPRLQELAVRDNHQLYLAIAHRAWGVAYRLAGEFADAEIRLRQALDMFTTLGARWQVGRTLVELGELEIGRRAPAVARDHFARAVDEFRALGAAPDMLRTQTALEELHGG